MAGFISEYLSHELLDHVFGAAAYTAPATLYCALFTVAPTAGGGGTEVTGGSYARVPITNNATNFPAAVGQTKRNGGTAITFPAPTADWGTADDPVIGAAWFDASTAGNMLMYGPFSTSRVILDGDSAPSIVASGGTFTLE
jgi:hypothetical protein